MRYRFLFLPIFAEKKRLFRTKMKTKRFSCSIYAWTLFVCAFGLVSCHDLTIDNGGYLSMMNRGTIVGNDEDGYYLFSDGRNEVAICYGKGLDKYERAYYSLSFKEENRFFSDRTPGFTIIDNARVGIVSTYKVIHPISKAEADKRGITHPDSCSVDENFYFSNSYGAYCGYFDFSTLATITHDLYTHYEYASIPIDLVYDPARQSPDTLRLELCYRHHVPEGWEKYRYEAGTFSCDISGLANLQEWNDSLCIVVDTGDKQLHYMPISKKGFKKPEPFFDF